MSLWMWGHLAANIGTSKQAGGERVSTISLLGCSTSVALAMGPTDKDNFKTQSTTCLNLKLNIFFMQTSYVFHTILTITTHYFTSSISYSLVGTLLDPWAGRLKHRGSIPNIGKIFFSSPKHSHWLCGPCSPLHIG
jgi:hypothetical protein